MSILGHKPECFKKKEAFLMFPENRQAAKMPTSTTSASENCVLGSSLIPIVFRAVSIEQKSSKGQEKIAPRCEVLNKRMSSDLSILYQSKKIIL